MEGGKGGKMEELKDGTPIPIAIGIIGGKVEALAEIPLRRKWKDGRVKSCRLWPSASRLTPYAFRLMPHALDLSPYALCLMPHAFLLLLRSLRLNCSNHYRVYDIFNQTAAAEVVNRFVQSL